MKMLSLGVTGLMCARRPTPQSYTCRTPSRVFTFQALLDYALDPPYHQVCILSFLVSFRADYLTLGFRQQHQRAAAIPLFPDPGILGADATSNTPHTIVDMPNEYIDDMVHLLTSIESLSTI